MEKLPGSSLDEGFRWIEIDEQDLRLLFRKHWRLIVWFPVAAVLAALSYCLIATPLYTTSTLLYLRPNFDKDLQVEQVFSKLEDDDSLRSLEKAVVSDTTATTSNALRQNTRKRKGPEQKFRPFG